MRCLGLLTRAGDFRRKSLGRRRGLYDASVERQPPVYCLPPSSGQVGVRMEHLEEGMDHEEMFKILAIVFKKEVEISRKIYTVHNTQQLINQTCDAGFQIDRLLKFDADFSEFIDVDPNVCISDLDKFQIYLCESTNSQADNAMACHVQQPNPEQTTGLEPLIQKKLPEIFEEIRINGIVSEKTRLKLVKLVVSDLVERHGFYPSSDEKVALAGTIITTVPCLKVQVDGKGQGFEHFYDPSSHTGFLEIRLRNIRRKLEEDQRRYRKHKRRREVGQNPVQEVQDANDTRELINLMKRLRPSAENLASIKSGMQRTFTHRRSWISSLSPTMGEVFQEYPRFLDIPALFDSEFNTLCEGKGDLFMRRWEAVIIPQLTAVAVKEKHIASLTEGMDGLIDDERSYRMLQILTHLLPPIACSRCSVKSAITHLIDFVPTGTSISSLCTDDSESHPSPPHLLSIGSFRDPIRQYVIIGKNDKVIIPLDQDLTGAVDKLFKLFWVCNLAYPPQLSSVFSFLEYVYNIPLSTNRKSKVVDLISKMKMVK
ncbi:hypothetical protein N1851_018921 [Merluccius polli]|uniref:Uncharacterized protein n=1 Tax=Merluccius polli TaxID=89951 RepID=A0AA47MMD7_MERPO|nr:hypothetical protein N1851_018921 [Merluccius polli]